MQLHVARLCLDCQEVHGERACPKCLSESYALLSKWVPAPDRRARPRLPSEQATVDTYRQLLTPEVEERPSHRWLKRGVLVAAIGAGGWLFRKKFRPQ
jgi:hypothetical protein